jgi:MFS family permease
MATAAAPGGIRYAFAPLRHRDFALFWWAGLVSNTGSWMQSITVPFVLYGLTKSNTWLGISAFASFFPALVMGPIAGTLADRFERRRILLATQTAQMGAASLLWALWVSGHATKWNILGCLLVSGIASGLNIASWQSFVPLLVPAEDMVGAVRLNSLQFTGARAFGPALAGLVLSRFGPGVAFFVNAVTFLLVLAALAAVSPRAAVPAPDDEHWLRQFAEGWRYTRARDALFLPVLTTTLISLFGTSLLQLAAAFADEDFDVGKGAYGLLVAAYGAGAIVGAVLMSAYGDHVRRSRTATIGLSVFCIGILLLAAAPAYVYGLSALFVMGVSYLMVSVSMNTSIQVRVEEHYRGRVLSIYLMGLLAGVPLGALAEGRLADVIGLRPTTAIAGGGMALYTVFALIRYRGMAPLDESVEDE